MTLKITHKSLSPARFIDRALMRYMAWRIGATELESRSYNRTDRVLLTFDDFGEDENVRGVLAVLRDKQVRAAFFIVGDWAEQHPELMKQIAAEGHWLGNHTKTHANLVALSDEAVRVEVLGGPHATLLRPPYGAYDGRVRRLARELGYALAFWTLDTKDWTGLGASAMTDRVAGSIDRGGCVLMHLNAPHTLAALPGIIEVIRARGLELCHEGNEIVL